MVLCDSKQDEKFSKVSPPVLSALGLVTEKSIL